MMQDTEQHTAEPLVPKPSSSETGMAFEKLNSYVSSTDQIVVHEAYVKKNNQHSD